MKKLELTEFISAGKLKATKRPWHKYLEGKILILFEFGGAYNLLAIKDEKSLKGLCKYAWEHDEENSKEYDCLDDFIGEVELGNDGFGFDKDEIELCDIETLKKGVEEMKISG